jgi:hypothetical protein
MERPRKATREFERKLFIKNNATKLKQMEDLGFFRRSQNAKWLERYGGDIDAAMCQLRNTRTYRTRTHDDNDGQSPPKRLLVDFPSDPYRLVIDGNNVLAESQKTLQQSTQHAFCDILCKLLELQPRLEKITLVFDGHGLDACYAEGGLTVLHARERKADDVILFDLKWDLKQTRTVLITSDQALTWRLIGPRRHVSAMDSKTFMFLVTQNGTKGTCATDPCDA